MEASHAAPQYKLFVSVLGFERCVLIHVSQAHYQLSYMARLVSFSFINEICFP